MNRANFEDKVNLMNRALGQIEALKEHSRYMDLKQPGDYVKVTKSTPRSSARNIPGVVEQRVSIINVTSLVASQDNLIETEGLAATQEHQTLSCMRATKCKPWQRQWKQLALGPSCMASGHSSAGVGYQHDATIISMQLDTTSNNSRKACDAGRATHCAIVIDRHNSFIVDSADGDVGGHNDAVAA